MRTTLASDSKWYILKLASMSTIVREWVALHNVPYLPFRQSVLTGKPPLKLSNTPLLIPEVRCQQSFLDGFIIAGAKSKMLKDFSKGLLLV